MDVFYSKTSRNFYSNSVRIKLERDLLNYSKFILFRIIFFGWRCVQQFDDFIWERERLIFFKECHTTLTTIRERSYVVTKGVKCALVCDNCLFNTNQVKFISKYSSERWHTSKLQGSKSNVTSFEVAKVEIT